MTQTQTLADALRQMIAVLEEERQALAAMDIDALSLAGQEKHMLCGTLEGGSADPLDAECRSLLELARHANEVNRRVRNLMAANVASRLNALTGGAGTYRAGAANASYAVVRA